MNKRQLIHKLQEATSLAQTDVILNKLKASPLQRKSVEMGLLQKLSNTAAAKEYGANMINTVIREIENDNNLKSSEEPAIAASTGVKPKGDHFVQEELLENGDTGSANTDSEQSSSNTEPYPQEGTEEDVTDMTDASNTENQMKEGMGMPPGMIGQGMPPMMPGMMPPQQQQMGGSLDPAIAAQMGGKMPQLPALNTPQQMQQMQYTLNNYHKRFVLGILREIQNLKTVAKKQSQQIQETMALSGSMTLDMDSLRKNSMSRVRETTNSVVPQFLTVNNKAFDVQSARTEILQLNEQIAEQHR